MSEEHFSPECEVIEPELNAYLDDELAPPEQMTIERHLEECAACRAELELLRLVAGSLGQVVRPHPSESMWQRLLAQVAAELPPRRMEIICTERHGGETLRRREVSTYREPAVWLLSQPATTLPASPAIQRYRRELSDRPNCCQIIESYYGRD